MLKNNKNNFFLLKLFFILLFMALISSCGKSFSGAILEKEDNNKTYIEADGRTFHKIGFAKKVDIQPYITIAQGNQGLVIRGEYEKFGSIAILGLDLSDKEKILALECDKRYSKSFFNQNEVCDGLVVDEDIPILEEILSASVIEVVFSGEKDSIKFEMTNEQKKVFSIILKKYLEL